MLPGVERWHEDLVTRVIEFELKVAEAMPSLLASTAEASGYSDPEAYAAQVPSDGPFAVMRAIELAFATDRFGEAFRYGVQLVTDKRVQPRTPMQVAQWACVGAIYGTVRVDLGAAGARFSWHPFMEAARQDEPAISVLPWPPVRSQAKVLIQRLIPAALLSGTIGDLVTPDFTRAEAPDKRLWAAVETTDEFRVARDILGMWMTREDRIGALRTKRGPEAEAAALGLWSMERGWSARLDALRSSAEWDLMMIRSSLFDWSLLSLWIAFDRYAADGIVLPPRSEDAVFIRALAKRFAQLDSIGEPQF